MSSITTYVMLVFGISVFLYLVGYTSPFMTFVQNASNGDVFTSLLNSFINIFTNPIFLTSLGLSAVASFITGGNYNVVYLFPILMLVVLANYFVLPTSFLNATEIPSQLKLIISTFLNLFLVLSVVEFVRGG